MRAPPVAVIVSRLCRDPLADPLEQRRGSAMLAPTSGSRSVSAYAACDTRRTQLGPAQQASARRPQPPGHPAARRLRRPRPAPCRAAICSSSEPSPVMTRSAPASCVVEADEVEHQVDARAQLGAQQRRRRRSRLRRRRRRPACPGGPASGLACHERRPSGSRAASSSATSSGVAPFCGPKTAAAPRRPGQRVVDVAGDHELDAGHRSRERGSGRPTRRRPEPPPPRPTSLPSASSSRAPSACTMPAPPSVDALPPMPSTTSAAAVDGGARSPGRARTWSRSSGAGTPPGSRSRPDDVGQLHHGPSPRAAYAL